MKEFWDERFASEEYVYGTAPNTFFKEKIDTLPVGRILLPAEGEGRNAVYAAQKGWKVDAIDFSKEGRRKALELAKKNGVKIQYELINLEDFHTDNRYNLIGLFYAHMQPEQRKIVHSRLSNFLAPEGQIMLEAFSEEQISRNSGGPKNKDMLFSKTKLTNDFYGLHTDYLEELEVDISEGKFHSGTANIIRMIASSKK